MPSRAFEQYRRAIQDWRLANLKLCTLAKQALVARLPEDQAPVRVDRYFCFRHERLWGLAGRPKKIDATNRVKVFDDMLAEHILGLDDLWFWSGITEKVSVARPEDEQVIVVLTPVAPATLDDLLWVEGEGPPAIVARAQALLRARASDLERPVLPSKHGQAGPVPAPQH